MRRAQYTVKNSAKNVQNFVMPQLKNPSPGACFFQHKSVTTSMSCTKMQEWVR